MRHSAEHKAQRGKNRWAKHLCLSRGDIIQTLWAVVTWSYVFLSFHHILRWLCQFSFFNIYIMSLFSHKGETECHAAHDFIVSPWPECHQSRWISSLPGNKYPDSHAKFPAWTLWLSSQCCHSNTQRLLCHADPCPPPCPLPTPPGAPLAPFNWPRGGPCSSPGHTPVREAVWVWRPSAVPGAWPRWDQPHCIRPKITGVLTNHTWPLLINLIDLAYNGPFVVLICDCVCFCANITLCHLISPCLFIFPFCVL